MKTLKALTSAATVTGLSLLVPSAADAHFTLVTPQASTSQDALGNPQKLGPCGDEAGGTPTGKITTYRAGETIEVTIDEKIYHPGHYRIALAVNNRSELPAEPTVTVGATPCGSAPIDSSPKFPVLADGLLLHTAPFSGPQTVKVTLPSNVSCARCTLQVIEFMSNHGLNNPGGCYYHHCADVTIQPSDGGAFPAPPSEPADGGGDASGAGSPGAGASGAGSSGGCAITASSPAAASVLFMGLAVALGAMRRRRRA